MNGNGRYGRRGTKRHLYETAYERQGGLCASCGKEMEDPAGAHLDRVEVGGPYEIENVRLLHTECHRDRHDGGASSKFPELRKAYDNYKFWVMTRASLAMKHRKAAEAWWVNPVTLDELGRLLEQAEAHEKYFEKELVKELKRTDHPIVGMLLGVPGVGPMTAAMLLARIDPAKAEYASSLWKFFGYAGPSKDRYREGVKGGGSKADRSALYNWANTQVKLRTDYRREYDERRAKTDQQDTWRSNMHRMMDGYRVEIKLFLSHVWQVYRELEGLPVPDPYALAMLGHQHYKAPEEYGWPMPEERQEVRAAWLESSEETKRAVRV